MSTVAFIMGMVAAGFSYEDAIKAAEIMEQTVSVDIAYVAEAAPQRSKAAERTARWRAKQAEEVSQTVTDRHEPSHVTLTPSLSLLPPRPPNHPHPPAILNPL